VSDQPLIKPKVLHPGVIWWNPCGQHGRNQPITAAVAAQNREEWRRVMRRVRAPRAPST